MMKNPVMIKGNKYGFTLYLDPEMDFAALLPLVGERFLQSNRFFTGDSQIAIRFEGKELTFEEQNQVIEQIEQNSQVRISYIMDENERNEEVFREAVEEYGKRLREAFAKEKEDYKKELLRTAPVAAGQDHINLSKDGQFYKGTLRSGQSVEVEKSIVIVGDVNPGADVIAGGNIVVLGCLKGSVSAGYPENRGAFVVALDMQPMQVRIGDLIARSPDDDRKGKKKKKEIRDPEARIAYVENENIYIEPISRSLMNDINTNS
ncbi:MAG: septum site-determining protein MinC [Lachnospiraceae bacterium]|nr:septum site-determining protein MinC [Lachnospiraceae bacterium]